MSISEREPRSSGNSGCPEHVRNSLDATWSIAIDSGDSRRDITSFGGTPRGADQNRPEAALQARIYVPPVEKALWYIERHLTQDISLSDIAASACVSRKLVTAAWNSSFPCIDR